MSLLGTISGQVRLNTRQAVAAYAALRAQNARTVYALRGTGEAFTTAGQNAAFAGAAMVAGFAKTVSAAAEFERKMDFYGAVSDASADDIDRLRKFTLKLAEDTIYSANEITDGIVELGKAGVDTEKIIDGIGEAMTNLGAAGDIPLAQSGQIITSTIQQFAMSADEAVKVTDLLAGAANASIADITDLGVSLKYAGGVANAAGLDFEDTLTAISLLAKAGIRGSTAGTSLRQMMVSFGGATNPARDVLSELGILLEDGTNLFFTQEGQMKSLSDIFQILQRQTADLSEKERLMALRTIFNNRALSAASILTRDGAKGFREMNREMTKVKAADVAAQRLDNLSGDIEILQGNIETMLIRAGGPFQEELRRWTQALTKLVQAFDELDPKIQEMIIRGVGLSGAFLLIGGSALYAIGMFLRILAAGLRFAAGVKFMVKWVRGLLFLFGTLGGVAISGTFLAIAAVIGIVVGAFILAYKKIAPFRDFINNIASSFMNDFVNPLIGAVKKVIAWFKKFAKDPAKGWEDLKDKVGSAVDATVNYVKSLPGRIWAWLKKAGARVGEFVTGVWNWFKSLPGRIFSYLGNLVSRVGEMFTFRNVGYALGFLLGTILRIWLKIQQFLFETAGKILVWVSEKFQMLRVKVIAAIGKMVSAAVQWLGRMRQKATALAWKIVIGVIKFFQKLPERIRSFFIKAAVWVGVQLVRMWKLALKYGPLIFQGIINFLRDLPSNLLKILTKMIVWIIRKTPVMIQKMKDLGRKAFNGVIDFLSGLPEKIGEILSDAIAKITGRIGEAVTAAKEFGSGLWEGFKDGMGINSPSYIERAMANVTGTLDSETKKLRKQTLGVKKISEDFARTRFGVDTDPLKKMTSFNGMLRAKQVQDRIARQNAARGGASSAATNKMTTINNKYEVNNPRPERASESVTRVLRRKTATAGWTDE